MKKTKSANVLLRKKKSIVSLPTRHFFNQIVILLVARTDADVEEFIGDVAEDSSSEEEESFSRISDRVSMYRLVHVEC